MTKNFAITGVAGYVAPRHLKAVKETGNNLVAAVDPNDSVGILDSYFPEARFFTEFERFDRHIDKLRRKGESERVHYVSICSPNYLHDAHARFALRVGADVICEKPVVLNPWNIDALQELEHESGHRVYTVLQLRLHPSLIALKERMAQEKAKRRHEVALSYVTSRGAWYLVSWKGQLDRSGGLSTNIGIHFFDLLIWLFGEMEKSTVHLSNSTKAAGLISLKNADVKWFLSIETSDLPSEPASKGQRTFRSISIDDEEIEFSEGFTDLHTAVYHETLAGRGFTLDDARPSIVLAHQIRNAVPVGVTGDAHPFARLIGT